MSGPRRRATSLALCMARLGSTTDPLGRGGGRVFQEERFEVWAKPLLRTIPEPNKHLVRFYGVYANRVRSEKIPRNTEQEEEQDEEASHRRRALSKRWVELIYRIYEIDPLTCRRRGKK